VALHRPFAGGFSRMALTDGRVQHRLMSAAPLVGKAAAAQRPVKPAEQPPHSVQVPDLVGVQLSKTPAAQAVHQSLVSSFSRRAHGAFTCSVATSGLLLDALVWLQHAAEDVQHIALTSLTARCPARH
jgi:hypothetical protein